MGSYSHLVTVEKVDDTRVIRIYIVPDKGEKYFSTDINLPPSDEKRKWDLFDQLACQLGKAICIDSPEIRDHFNLNED
jgi:hypothetical protein